jgi:hypothetical protein
MEQRTAIQSALMGSRQQNRPHTAPQPVNIPTGLNSAGVSHRPQSTPRSIAAQPRNIRNAEPTYDQDYDPIPAVRTRPEPTYHSLSAGARNPSHRPGMQNGDQGGNNSDSGSSNRFRRS